jgi:hypothetical protein
LADVVEGKLAFSCGSEVTEVGRLSEATLPFMKSQKKANLIGSLFSI